MELDMYVPDIYTEKQLCQQNISSLKKIFIMNIFHLSEVELNEIILRR